MQDMAYPQEQNWKRFYQKQREAVETKRHLLIQFAQIIVLQTILQDGKSEDKINLSVIPAKISATQECNCGALGKSIPIHFGSRFANKYCLSLEHSLMLS